MSTKTLELRQVKATPQGMFTAIASTFSDEPDLQGDVIDRYAFDESIKGWQALEAWPPVFRQHSYMDPEAEIGTLSSMEATDAGLMVEGKLDITTNELAALTFKQMDTGKMKYLSIGYSVPEGGEKRLKSGATLLTKIDLHEVSIVQNPANTETAVLAMKSVTDADVWAAGLAALRKQIDELETKTPPWHIEERDGSYCVVANETGETVKCHPTREDATAHMAALYANVPDASKDDTKVGREISAKNETRLRSARDEIDAVLSALGEQKDFTSKTTDETPANVEDPTGKTDELGPNAKWLQDVIAAHQG